MSLDKNVISVTSFILSLSSQNFKTTIILLNIYFNNCRNLYFYISVNITRYDERIASFFSRLISTLAISTGATPMAAAAAAAAAASASAAGVGRRASIIHSAGNQKSWKHTFMRRVVPEE